MQATIKRIHCIVHFVHAVGATQVIYTMNVTEDLAKDFGYGAHFAVNERALRVVFGSAESLLSYDTYQFADYSTVEATRFDPERKATRRREVFPHDCEKAYAMGVRFATMDARS